jgi:hypothetical protein
VLLLLVGLMAHAAGAQKVKTDCRAAVLKGEVGAGEAYRREFSPGLEFFLEPLKSGWIMRVLERRGGQEVRGAHDWAEVATPPYRSVSPLLISTDWAFRAQDAAAWNPREFRYAADAKTFARLSALEERAEKGDRSGEVELSELVAKQPEGVLRLLDVTLAPGTRDQAGTAAPVASHLAETPHAVSQSETPSPLGRLVRIQFSVRLDLPAGRAAAPGVEVERFPCGLRPTG